MVNRHFQLRTCTDHVLHNRRRPCLQYQIKRCPAPCVLPVAREAYDEQVRDVRLFLDGKSDELLDAAARAHEGRRRAHRVRAGGRHPRSDPRAGGDAGGAAGGVGATSSTRTSSAITARAIALEIVVMSIRAGKLSGNRAFSFTGQEFPDAELLSSFVGLYYDMGASVPDEVLLPIDIEDAALKAEWLTEQSGARRSGGRKKKVEMLRAPARRSPQAGRAGAQERGRQLRHAPQRARRHRAGAGQAAAPAEAAAAAAHDRVLRRLAPAGVRDGGVDGRVRRRAAGQGALPHVQGARAGRRRARRARTTTSRRCTRCCRGGSGARRRRQARRRLEAARPDRGRRRQGPAGDGAGGGARRRHRGGSGRRALDRRAREGARGGTAAAAAPPDEPSGEAAADEPLGEAGGAAAAARPQRPPSARAARRAPPAPAAARTRARDAAKKPDRVFLPHAKDAIPIRPSSARDVRAAGAARRGAPLRGQLPPRPAPPADAALGARRRSPASGPAASASCCGTSAASSACARPRSTSWPRSRA